MTWGAVLTSGYRIAGTRTTKGPQATDRRGPTRLVSHGSFDPALGETTKAMSDRLVAKLTTPVCGTQLVDSALLHRPRGRASCVLFLIAIVTVVSSLLPTGAFSQGKSAPDDAYLIRMAAGWHSY